VNEPQRFILETPTPLDELSVKDLLTKLVAGEGDRTKTLKALKGNDDVRSALGKTNEIIVPNADGGVNVDETVKYIASLAPTFGQKTRKVAGQFPITIEQAFDLTRMVMFNPITLDVVYVGVADKFGLGLVLSELDEKIVKALTWGLITGHEAMPRDLDEFAQEELFEQLFGERLPARVRRVMEDYQRAVQKGDLVAQGIICRMSEEQAQQLLSQFSGGGSGAPSSASTSRSSGTDYEALVRQHAELSPETLRIDGHNHIQNDKICEQFSMNGHNNIARRVVVMDGGSVDGHANLVELIMPPRKDVRRGGHNNSVKVTNMTWENIARHLGLV
jgi:hypothetical protein